MDIDENENFTITCSNHFALNITAIGTSVGEDKKLQCSPPPGEDECYHFLDHDSIDLQIEQCLD